MRGAGAFAFAVLLAACGVKAPPRPPAPRPAATDGAAAPPAPDRGPERKP